MKRKAVFAEEKVLQAYNCAKSSEEICSLDKEHYVLADVFSCFGWKVSSFHSNILKEEETISMTNQLRNYLNLSFPSTDIGEVAKDPSLRIRGNILHTPPMLFGKDILQLQFGDVALSINPCHAIFCWAAQHTEESLSSCHPFRAIRVPYAKNWMSRQEFPGLFNDSVEAKDNRSVDWTFSSDYCFTIIDNSKEEIISAFNIGNYSNDGQKAGRWSISPSASSGIDYDMLRQQDLPILLYDECLLYQDDLEDCGEVDFEAKLRVMPNCWFLLSKMFLRVDGVILRSRETRLFHKFPSSPAAAGEGAAAVEVSVEVLWREYSSEQTESVFTLPTSASSFLSSSLEREDRELSKLLTSRDSRNKTNLLPIINHLESIPQFFTIQIFTH